MAKFRIYIYGDIDNYKKTYSFLSSNDNIFHIKSISEFIKDSKTHDTYDKSAILNAGYAVDLGFYEYYNVFPIKEDEIVFCSIKIANDTHKNGIFKNSTLINKKINSNFIMSNSHLLCELIQDGWAEFNKNIEDLNINIYIDEHYPIYEISDNLYEKFKHEWSIYNQINEVSNEIKEMQKNGVSQASIDAFLASQQRLEQQESHKQNVVENSASMEHNNPVLDSSLVYTTQGGFVNSQFEHSIKSKIKQKSMGGKNPDYIQYFNNKYGRN